MLEYQRLRRETNLTPETSDPQPMPRRPLPSRAAHSQARGLCGLDRIMRSLSKGSLSNEDSPTPDPPFPSTPSEPETERAVRERRIHEQDSLTIEIELERYRAAGTINDMDELMDFDILVYWQVNTRQFCLSTCTNEHYRLTNTSTLCSTVSHLTFSPPKHPPCLANACFRLARRLTLTVATAFRQR